MNFTQRRTVTIFGIKVSEVEVSHEFADSGGSTLALDPDYMTPVLAEAVKCVSPLAPESFSFETGPELVVNGNVDAYTATQRA